MATSETKLSMKLLIDTKTKKVLFAEVSKDFVDFLFHILTLPLSTVTKLLRENGMNGCLRNIYESVENLDDTYIQSKHLILEPKCPVRISSVPLLLLNDIPIITALYKCCSSRRYCSSSDVTDEPSFKCLSCGSPMSSKVTYVAPSSVKGGFVATEVFVKDVMKYLVMDDLVVKPVSAISSITGLNRYFNVKDVSALREEIVHFGKEEALKLLKLSFESKAVLTSVFMSRISTSRVKVENS